MEENELNREHANLIEAEQKLLGIAIHSPNALPEILSSLTKDDFFVGSHKIVYDAIERLHKTSKEISSITIIDELEDAKQLKQAGGVEAISALSDTYYSDEKVDDLIGIVFKKAMGRKFDKTLQDILELRRKNPNLEVVLDKAQTEILNIDFDYKKDETQSIAISTQEVINKIKKLENEPEELTGVSSGFNKLDKITSGFQSGDLIILAARPSMGKTAFALNLAYNAASFKSRIKSKHKNAVAIFSIEMPKEQLTQRILSSLSLVEPVKIRTGQRISTDEWKRIHLANDRLQTTNIFIDDLPGITVQQIQSKLHKLKRDENVNLCIIDYLQLITTPGSSGENRQNEISNISRQLKRIARDTGVPIICLSQLSRSVEKREDKRPMMSDLRDSGAIEQDADIIMFLYREEYYKNGFVEDKTEKNNQETELIISKHRNGSTGTIKLNFDLEFGKFVDLTE